MSLLSIVGENWVNYAFGSYTLAGIAMILFFMLYSFKLGLSFDGMIVVAVPLIFIMTDVFVLTSINLHPIVLIVAGGIIGLAIKQFVSNA